MRKQVRSSIRGRQNLTLFLPLLALLGLRLATDGFPAAGTGTAILDGAGFACLAAGLWIRVCARQWKAERQNDALVTDGLYGYVRHPLYAGSFLFGIGLCLILGDPVLLVAFGILFPINHGLVIRSEEEHLELLFGQEYARYRSEVPGYLPRWRTPALRVTPRRTREGVVREGDALCIGMALPVLIGLGEWAAETGFGSRPGALDPSLPVLLLLLLALALLWARLKRDYRALIREERRHRRVAG